MEPSYAIRTSVREDGDYADPAHLEPGTTWLRQVHGARIVHVTRPGEHAGTEADAAFTTVPGVRLAVRTADCAPLVFTGGGALAVVHVGWRGLMAGLVEAAIDAMTEAGVQMPYPVLGACIRPECYEFGAADLDTIAARYGDAVRGRTRAGAPALDLAAGINAALAVRGVGRAADRGECTACLADRYFSYRARGETQRMATVASILP